MYAVDMNGRFLGVNEAASSLLKQSTAELIGRTIGSLYASPEERVSFVRDLTAGRRSTFLLRLRVAMSEDRTLLDTARVIRDVRGLPVGLIGYLTDVTEPARALRFLNQIPTGIYVADADGMLRFVNLGFAIMLGYGSRSEMERVVNVKRLYADEGKLEEFVPVLQRALEQRTPAVTEDLLLKRRDGTEFWGRAHVRPYTGPDGKSPWREGTLTDIDREHRFEDALARLPGFYQLKKEGTRYVFERCSEHVARLLGFRTPEEVVGQNPESLTYPKDIPALRSFAADVESSDTSVKLPRLRVLKKGIPLQYRLVMIHAIALRNRVGNVTGRTGFIQELNQEHERFKLDTAAFLHSIASVLVNLRGAMPTVARVVAEGATPTTLDSIPAILEERAGRILGALEPIVRSRWFSSLANGDPRRETLVENYNLWYYRQERCQTPAVMPPIYREFAARLLDEIKAESVPSELRQHLEYARAAAKSLMRDATRLALDEATTDLESAESELRLHRRWQIDSSDPIIFVPIDRVILAVIDEWKDLAAASGIVVRKVDMPEAQVRCNERRLTTALSHLVHNAIKYSWSARYDQIEQKPDGYRFVSINGSRSTVHELVIGISNLGVAITRKELDSKRLFVSGYRGEHSGDAGRVGTGLGLSYAKDVIEELGGSVEIESRPASQAGKEGDYSQPFLTVVTVRLPTEG